MKNILIYKKINNDLECNINTHYTNTEIASVFKKYYSNNMPNTGNKVWFQAIVNEVSVNNNITFLSDNMDQDFINNNFDMIIYPMANIFGSKYVHALESIAEFFEKIKIPTYIISCGIQASTENEIGSLCDEIGNASKRFINSIYQTGGQFALRGYKTNEFFSLLGFDNAAVIGCPSLYQKGSKLTIPNKKMDKNSFKVILNGNIADYNTSCFDSGRCTFIDQDTFVNPLFDKEFVDNLLSNKKNTIDAIKYFGYNQLVELFKGNIELFFETNLWYNHIIKNNYSFSFGSRIHGNIMSLLSGVPTLINAKDVRVKEMAELYNIPYIENQEISSIDELYDLYLNLDYSNFNNQYKGLYEQYKRFMIDNNIVETLGTCNCFTELSDEEYGVLSTYPNEAYFDKCLSQINKFKLLFKLINYIR